jgi:hypothetical protein
VFLVAPLGCEPPNDSAKERWGTWPKKNRDIADQKTVVEIIV